MADDRFGGWQPPELEHGKLTKWNWVVFRPENFTLAPQTDIGCFTAIFAHHGVTIEEGVQIGSHCSIYSLSTISTDGSTITGPVIIKKGAQIGTHSTIMPGVTIGENAIVGAYSFVKEDVPANTTVFGVPAKPKR
jgi:acetyltransferase-like isoleucine patch superfamily enzyme